MITDKDEHLHTPIKEPMWRESYYFNVMDPEHNIFTVSTMGYMPTEGESHYFSIIYVDDKLYMHINYKKLKKESDFKENPSDGHQSFTILKENHAWEIKIMKNQFQLAYIWTGRFPVYEYPGGWQIPKILQQQHYEQSGYGKGRITLKDGTSREFCGFGHRDHSWGVRNWVYIDEWYWTSVQFKNGKIALNTWLTRIDQTDFIHGFISTADGNVPITSIEVKTKFQKNASRSPRSALFRLIDKNGTEYQLEAETLHLITLPQSSKSGTCYIYETISQFQMGGEKGYGVAEYLRSEKKV
ncbi:MAG: DUF7065 domain-containing protein [Candidatus Helarchaeota archaeon]